MTKIQKDNLRKIWSRVCKSDAAAWRQLVERYAVLVNTVARRVGLSVPDAEDCAQHTWLTLYRRRKAIKDPQSLPAWLIRTTHRQAVHMAERLNYNSEADAAELSVDPAILPDEVVQQLEHQAILNRAMELLDPRCRQLIAALYLDGEDISYRKLAARLGLAPNSVGSLRGRCLKKLQKIIEKMGYGAD